MSEQIELLTRGPNGHAVPGVVVDYDWRSITYEAAGELGESEVAAIICTFVWMDDKVRFFVPMDLLEEVHKLDPDGEEYACYNPTEEALRLVEERLLARRVWSGGREQS